MFGKGRREGGGLGLFSSPRHDAAGPQPKPGAGRLPKVTSASPPASLHRAPSRSRAPGAGLQSAKKMSATPREPQPNPQPKQAGVVQKSNPNPLFMGK